MNPVAEKPVATAAPDRAPAPRRRRPPIAWRPSAATLCVIAAVVNAVVWSLIVPSFQGPDEAVHAGYVQYLAETGRIPRPTGVGLYYAPPLEARIAFQGVPFSLDGSPTWSKASNAHLQHELGRPLPRKGEGGAGYAYNNPPLYYALEAVPYWAAHSGTFLDRLFAMRLLSALMAGATVLFIYLFMRELMPHRPWTWAVGALAVAFQPVFAFVSGTVNNDVMMWTLSAAIFWLLARAFRRGLTPRIGAGLGAAVAAGVLTKGSVYGLVPGIALALGLLVWRAPERRRALKSVALAAAVTAVPVAAWLLANHYLWQRPGSTTSSGVFQGPQWSVRQFLSYLWQFYLPRLPWMRPEFPYHAPHYPTYPSYPLWQTYFQGLVGRFGWFEYGFPLWVSELALGIWVVLLALAGRTVVRSRATLRRRWPELASYVAMAAGLAVVVAFAGYRHRMENYVNFEQTRYLFPLLALYAALVVVAARGAGRYGAALGVFLVVLAIGHNTFAQLLTIDRYYASTRPPVYQTGPKPPPTKGIKLVPEGRPARR